LIVFFPILPAEMNFKQIHLFLHNQIRGIYLKNDAKKPDFCRPSSYRPGLKNWSILHRSYYLKLQLLEFWCHCCIRRRRENILAIEINSWTRCVDGRLWCDIYGTLQFISYWLLWRSVRYSLITLLNSSFKHYLTVMPELNMRVWESFLMLLKCALKFI